MVSVDNCLDCGWAVLMNTDGSIDCGCYHAPQCGCVGSDGCEYSGWEVYFTEDKKDEFKFIVAFCEHPQFSYMRSKIERGDYKKIFIEEK